MPDEITHANEQHAVFLALDDTFYSRTYVRIGTEGVEVFNGRLLSSTPRRLDIQSYALAPREVVLVVATPMAAAPEIYVNGRAAPVVEIHPSRGDGEAAEDVRP